MISIRKKKLTQWLRLIHIGKPAGAPGCKAAKGEEGLAGKPKKRYCNQVAPNTPKKSTSSMIFVYGFIPK